MIKILLSILLISSVSLQAMQKENITNDIKKMTKDLIKITLSTDEEFQKRKEIEKIIKPLFNFKIVGKLSLGKRAWSKATKIQRQDYMKYFVISIKNFYINKFSLYKNQEITFLNITTNKKKLILHTIVMDNNIKNKFDYKMYKTKKNGWLVYDMNIAGISIIKVFKAQYKDYLKNNSLDDLIKMLKSNA